jgi:hypothetical protein
MRLATDQPSLGGFMLVPTRDKRLLAIDEMLAKL